MIVRTVVPFRYWHFDWLVENNPTADGVGMHLPASALEQLEQQNTWTGAVDGAPIACGGTMEQWPGRHQAWIWLGDLTGPHMLWITREAQRCLERVRGRIEVTVRSDFAAGHRWAKMLGFELETPCMKGFGPQGEDHASYVRFN